VASLRIPPLHPIHYTKAVRGALQEDLGTGGDLTTDATVPADAVGSGRIVARAPGRIAGAPVARSAFCLLDESMVVEVLTADGQDADTDSVVLEIRGSVRAMLTAERTALNFLGHLSGIATLTRHYVEAASGHPVRIVCTRKTTPGLRILEKYAVRCGGGSNHRFGLDDAVLIKDNHLVAAGGVARAVEQVRRSVGHTVTVELEVDTLDQLEEGLAAGVDAVLLDNMSIERLRSAVAAVDGRAITEASGGVTLDNVAEVAATGVDIISVGALTHSAPSLDLSMEIDP
jgi:nicotinate-nucleotide pyrophosphorylase (carboxylating)